MTITTYTDREIALTAQLSAMTAERDEYQQAADKMAMEHKVERDTLRQALAEAQALIEASRKQEAVAWFNAKRDMTYLNNHYADDIPLYAAPVVADDVLKDAQRYRFLEYQCRVGEYRGIISRKAIDAAMGGAE